MTMNKMNKLQAADSSTLLKIVGKNPSFKYMLSDAYIKEVTESIKNNLFKYMVADIKYFNIKENKCFIEVSEELYDSFAFSIKVRCESLYDDELFQLCLDVESIASIEEKKEKINEIIDQIKLLIDMYNTLSLDIEELLDCGIVEEFESYYYDESYNLYELKPVEF